MTTAETLVALSQAWGALGALVAVAFVTVGIGRIDPDARGAYAFRPLIIPGVILLWPLVLWRWWVLETGRDQWRLRHLPPRRSHAVVWGLLAVVIPAVFITSLAIRQPWPSDVKPVRLSETGEEVQ